jgi:endoglucanase
MGFEIRRGVNVSHWLSQSERRGEERAAFFGRIDVELLAGLGFDHLRIPVDEEQLWDGSGEAEKEAWGQLGSALDWCAEFGLRAIVDLHILRSHHFNRSERPLWTDAACRRRFFGCWRELSARLGARPRDSVAYELLNEPVADDPDDWNRAAAGAIGVIRELEPERAILLGSNRWNSVDTFDRLAVPEGDENLLLSFHLYRPFLLTHHRARWAWTKDYEGPVHYPGRLVEEVDTEGLDAELRGKIEDGNGDFDRAALGKTLAKPLAAAERTGLPLHCGEFGCIRLAPRADRLRWYADVVSILAPAEIAWTIWDYKGGFGIVDGEGEPDRELVDILTA